jgi:hypothetical protein
VEKEQHNRGESRVMVGRKIWIATLERERDTVVENEQLANEEP